MGNQNQSIDNETNNENEDPIPTDQIELQKSTSWSATTTTQVLKRKFIQGPKVTPALKKKKSLLFNALSSYDC